MSTNLRYLALGDSYTIGEAVPKEDCFPFQTAAFLIEKGWHLEEPKIIAVTGWTTNELLQGIEETKPEGIYDMVTLLIGVNNQYRGQSMETYREEFEELLKKAIDFAAGENQRVTVMSIPDWGVTPFAEGRDRLKIATEIDAFNDAAQVICQQHRVAFLDITESTRQNGPNPNYLTNDGLHPSGKEYRIWAEKLHPVIEKQLRKEAEKR